jgi:plasmid maintenance system antidote protein VapI
MSRHVSSLSDIVKGDVRRWACLLLSDDSLHSPAMALMDNAAIRRENFRSLKAKHGSKKLADALGWTRQQLSQYIGKNPNRPVTDQLARRLERLYHLPPAWMDYPHYETEEVLQKIVDFARALDPVQRKALLQFLETADRFLREPPDKT